MAKPLFRIGEKVFHISANKYGTVTEIFKSNHGYRYYVKHGHQIWSVPELALTPKKSDFAPSDFN